MPIAGDDDPVRGVQPGRVDLPRTRRSGLSSTLGFVLVVGLLLAGVSLAFTGGGGILSSGGRFFTAEATPSPSSAAVTAVDPDTSAATGTDTINDEVPKAKVANMATYSCKNAAIKDLSRGRWFLTDVGAEVREDDDGQSYDRVFWKLSRTKDKKVKAENATTVSMKWTTPDAAKERFGDAIGRVQGDNALLITFNGPVDITADNSIEQYELEDKDIEQIKNVQLFERNKKVFSVIGLKGDSCARLGSVGWNLKSVRDNTRVVLDIERF